MRATRPGHPGPPARPTAGEARTLLARVSAFMAAVLLALATPAVAGADHGGSGGGPGPGGGGGRVTQVRAPGTCGKGATSTLKLKQHDSGIEVEFDAYHGHAGETWQVVLVQEGRVVWRTRLRTHAPTGSLSANHTIRVLSGADRVTARATGPGGITCVASAVLPG
jgi:hypothetical protein